MRLMPLTALVMLVLVAGPAAAAEKESSATRSPALSRLVACRALGGTEERLACYDREVAALDAAEARKDVMVVDREEVRKTRRSLFGLPLPALSIFGDDNPQDEEASRLEGKIKTASRAAYDKWVFDLEDGASWIQTDDRQLALDPRPGQEIVIRRGALGSYMANVNKQNGIRVKRIR